MVADALEAVLFGMAVDGVRPLASSFHDKTTEIAARTGGRLAFDVRIYGDRKYQRIAAIGYPGDEAGILALNHDGQAIEACFLDAGFAGFIEPLERWSSLPLRDQARNSVQGFADLLVAALRKAARLDISGGTGKVRADHNLSGGLVRPRAVQSKRTFKNLYCQTIQNPPIETKREIFPLSNPPWVSRWLHAGERL